MRFWKSRTRPGTDPSRSKPYFLSQWETPHIWGDKEVPFSTPSTDQRGARNQEPLADDPRRGGVDAPSPGVTGTLNGTEFTEDVAGNGSESGPHVLGRRQDGDGSPVSTSGDYHGLIFDAAGNLKVYVKGSADLTITGTVIVAGTVTSNAGSGIRTIGGEVAHGNADSGKPVKIGCKTVSYGITPSSVAAGQVTDWYANRHGIPHVLGGHPNIKTREYMSTTASTTDAIVNFIPVGTRIVVTSIYAKTSNSTSVDVQVRIGFGASAPPTEPTDSNSVDGVVLSDPGMTPGVKISSGDGSGIVGVGGSGEELRIACDVPTSGKLTVIVKYFIIEQAI